MDSLCYKCEKEIKDDDDYSECDSCDTLFHLKCGNVTKKEFNARQNSKCLQLYCPDCFQSKSNGTAAKLNEIIKVLYKLDLFNQEQKVAKDKTASSIQNQLQSLDKKISSNKTPVASSSKLNAKSRNQTSSYASVTKTSVKPAVVIKPKTKQISSKTFEDITNNVDKSQVNVRSTRNVRDGGVVLRCENATETMKVKQIVNDKLGDKYEVVLPKVKHPRLRITNIDPDIENDSILDVLKQHNNELHEINMTLITVIPRKFRSTSFNDIVIEVNGEAFNTLLELGALSLPWRECKIFEHLHVKRCYKCCGF